MPKFEREPRSEKVAAVEELKKILQSTTVILTDYQGLDVRGLMAFRKKLRESNSGYKIIKNTLLKRAAEDLLAKKLTDELVGPTAIVYSDDPVAAAKTLKDYTRGAKAIKLKSGIVDGQIVTIEQINELAKIPSREQLYAMLVGGLMSPITGLAGTLQGMLGQLVFTLQSVADQKAA
ncbi:MAG: 50S ribosomal protein L10 [Armatimonadetes bacterium]|nr:50S ribosomal protein L10 [Armatimonadota bacterium]